MSDDPIYCPNGEEVSVRAYHSPLSQMARIALEIADFETDAADFDTDANVAIAHLTHDQARDLIRRIEAALAEPRPIKETP